MLQAKYVLVYENQKGLAHLYNTFEYEYLRFLVCNKQKRLKGHQLRDKDNNEYDLFGSIITEVNYSTNISLLAAS